MSNKAYILLANGQIFEGKSFGASGCITGEIVFTTGMTGYLETLTDPSYYGQIIMQTFPLIGNYGVIPSDFESKKISATAYIVRDFCQEPSNFRCEGRLEQFLIDNNIVGVYGVDTRELTKIIRESGVMNARIFSPSSPDEQKEIDSLIATQKENLLDEIRSFSIRNAVHSVSSIPLSQSTQNLLTENKGKGKKVVLWNFGAKENIIRHLLKRNLDVEIADSHATADEIIAKNPDGIMLSNGPGDPAENVDIINELQKLCALNKPIFGICLGHQLLALANSAKTEKLKYGHRGANQSVKQLSTGRVFMTSQNHGYSVIPKTIPDGASMSFVNVNDGSCEGIEYSHINAFSVQYHPEAAGGPLDTEFLFDDFVKRL
ncbi:MAG: glutamine-hydrolyzing carbamoyl-phosphate synthase small subunit [Spirochaetales bacterium]